MYVCLLHYEYDIYIYIYIYIYVVLAKLGIRSLTS